MANRNKMAEIKCMEPENYRKYFRSLCWSGNRKLDRKPGRRGIRKDRSRRSKGPNAFAICFAPALLGNPSQFAVYATVRKSILSRWRHLQGSVADLSDDSDNDDQNQVPIIKLPKITGIGLRTVFSLIDQARFKDASLCECALKALLDVLQAHAPEDLSHENTEIITNLHDILVEITGGIGGPGRPDVPSTLTAISSSCLIALSVAKGEAELILNTVTSLIMVAPSLSEQLVQVPMNLNMLQRSVQSIILGSPSRNLWLDFGVPHQCLVNSFPVDLPPLLTTGSQELVIRSLVSDGCFLYVFTSKGLLKIGSGYGNSVRQHVYLYKSDFFACDRHGWLGYCKDKLYVRIGRKKTDIYEVDKETFEVKSVLHLDPGSPLPIEPKSAVFSDGNKLGLVVLTNYDNLTIKFYDVASTASNRTEGGTHIMESCKELHVHLLRRSTLALGRAPFEDGITRRITDIDSPVAVQLDDNEDDPLIAISAGQDFGLLTTASGKVYYTGKATSLGYKMSSTYTGRWTLMKETCFIRNEQPKIRKTRVIQVAVGHEGVHAILVLDNGSALFTGIARRGEDGDGNKRRSPKPSRPKKIAKAENFYVVYAACNYGSTALVTRQGVVLMFGKDTQHCDSAGIVTGLRHERIVQVALGKAHAVALTNLGQVYSFGINNKGQCGREFGYTKEKPYPLGKTTSKDEPVICMSDQHTWVTDYCRICVNCRECTGFAGNCSCAALPNRIPKEKCGCGEGESGCSTCGICRRCAEVESASRVPDSEDDVSVYDIASTSEQAAEEEMKYLQFEAHCSKDDVEKDASFKGSSLPPARIPLPGGHKVEAIACGLHHTVLMTHLGDVLTFGSNQYGALGAGDISAHHRIIRVRVPRASAIAAGSNHTAVLTNDGELYTFGSYQKGALGRPRIDEPRADRCPIWYATPGKVPRLGPKYNCKAITVSASGDQTFVQVSQAVLKSDTLFSSTITANNNTIIILPNRPEHTFKCVTICKTDGSCFAWSGAEQVDFVNTLACLDPLYDVLWCYQPQMRVMKSYNILAFDAHKLQRCCKNDPEGFVNDIDFEYPHYGIMRRLEEFRNLENFEWISNSDDKPTDGVAIANVSILNQDLALPSAKNCYVTRIHAALHLLGCIDSLLYVHDNRLTQVECKRDSLALPVSPLREDFLTVNRFESHGGGWGYSGHSIEAIRFMSDTDILLGGYGLFGGRGEYTAKIKLIDIGTEGGDQEGDGEVLAETGDIPYECAPRDRFPMLFENPIPLTAQRWYVAWACINGPSSDCGSTGQAIVINDDVGFHFKTSKKSNNGTDVNAGQIPCLLYNVINHDHIPRRRKDPGEPVSNLTKNISRKVTVACFKSLITLLQWSWSTFKEILLDTNGQIPINYHKLNVMKNQKRLVYIIRACLRIVKSYINEIYPQNNRKRNSQEYMAYVEIIADIRNLIQAMMADQTPTCSMLPRKPGRSKSQRTCYVQFALEMTNSIIKEAHETVTACFHAFYPTPILKWHHLCSLLYNVSDGIVPASQIRELTSTCAAMCGFRSLRDVLQYIVPVTQSCIMLNEMRKLESKVVKEVPSKSATVPRSAHSQHSPKPPPIPPRANRDARQLPSTSKSNHTDWHLLDIIPKLLDMVLLPIKEQMMTRQCGQPHDHGEIQQNEKLTDYCCKFVVRIIAELAFSSKNIKEDADTTTIKHLITPSRFIRVNTNRSWNTSNGSPDAICFTIDRPGIMLVGACVYGGPGTFEYTLELLHDVRLRGITEETRPSHCWISVEVVHGSFSAADCQHDMVQIKFEKPVPLKEDLRYALRFCNNGSRTSNGDSGLASVKGPDGTSFHFSSCSLSFNGTTLVRGQIPCLIYYGTTKPLNSADNPDTLMAALRAITLRVASMVIERGADLFCSLRNELTTEDLRRNAFVLQQSPVINTLMPYVLANLEGLDDSKSVIHLLEIIHKLLPHVSAMNLLVPSAEEISTTTTTHYYTWIESDHPYKQATVSNMRVLFPAQVSWIVLEMDPRSITAQPEDNLTIYAVAGSPRHRCHCSSEFRVSDPPFRKRLIQLTSDTGDVEELDEGCFEAPCMQYNCTYVSVTPRLSNTSADWPHKGLLVPGNEVIFSLETASDYLNEYKNDEEADESRFGFRCLCAGYEDLPLTSHRQGLVALEMELVYSGAACAARLLAPDIDISPLSYLTVVELQMLATNGTTPSGDEATDESEAMFLYRGLDLPSAPSVHNVLDGQPLLRCISTERQFLSDFVAGAESTAGGRLARWLAPTSRVEPSKCELKAPASVVLPTARVNLPVIVKDQYGDVVTSSAVKIEVIVQNLAMSLSMNRPTEAEQAGGIPNVRFATTIRETMRFQTITMMKPYQDYSLEELRFASGLWGEARLKGLGMLKVPTERITVHSQTDGSYSALWVPRAPGKYLFRCTLDDQPSPQEIVIEVPENENLDDEDTSLPAEGTTTKLKRFVTQCSAGLRVRASPSLQAEELGRIPPGAYVAYLEEVLNKDGAWVRLSGDSIQAYVESNVDVAWCMQYHRQLDCALLGPVEDEPVTPPEEDPSGWNRLEAQSELPMWPLDDDVEANDANAEERPFPFSIQCDLPDEEDRRNPALMAEPSKIDRKMRKEAAVAVINQPARLPLRQPRRNNGNGDGEDEVPAQAVQKLANNEQDANDANNVKFAEVVELVDESLNKMENDVNVRDDSVQKAQAIPKAAANVEDIADNNEADALKCPYAKGADVKNVIEAVKIRNAIEAVNVDKPVEDKNNADPVPPDKVEEEKILTQAATQTSPETSVQVQRNDQPTPSTSKDEKITTPRERVSSVSSFKRPSSPPPLPARSKPAPVKKQAQSPAQAECLRSIFAALLWHEGIVHDAIACAAFLKFHPQLPKAGALVVTRGAPHDPPIPKPQRHSVEVSNAGQYLRINPSTLETLTRSGTEASSSRARRSDFNGTIREEDSHSHIGEAGPSSSSTPSTSVVNVLPPALRALVALWDSLCDADQLNAATDKLKKEENNDNDEIGPLGGALRKKNWKYGPSNKLPYMVRCELCGGANVSPPLAAHMRSAHPGCRAPTTRGYDRAGTYKHADPIPSTADSPASACGQLAQAYQLWYLFCEKCREKALKAVSVRPKKSVTITEVSRPEKAEPEIDHYTMKDNAIFLLDLTPLNNSEAANISPWQDTSCRSPPTPPGSLWQPAPPFQCLPALGVAPKTSAADAARYHSLGRPLPATNVNNPFVPNEMSSSQYPRVHRSVSMGQAGGRDLAHAARPPLTRFEPDSQETLSGAGSSLLSQPSAALQKLVGCDWNAEGGGVSAFSTPHVDPESIIRTPVLSFILAKRDLQSHKQKLDAIVRINTLRQYAFEAMNWLLRSTSQPTCVHDVMWWFCNALDSYARIVQPPDPSDDNKENVLNDASRSIIPTAATSALCPGGRAARGARAAFHAFLGSISTLAPSLPPSSAANLQAVRCWELQYSQHDRAFLHRSQVFSVISKILSHTEDGAYEDGLLGALHESYQSYFNKQQNYVWSCPDVTGWCTITVSSRQGMAGALTDNTTETFWESGDEDKNKTKWIQIAYSGGSAEDKPHIVCIHIDNTRDPATKTQMVTFWYSAGPTDLLQMMDVDVDTKNAHWVCYILPRSSSTSVRVRCELRGPDPAVRVRQVRVLSGPQLNPSQCVQTHPLHSLTEKDTLRVFRLLTSQVFGKLLEWEQTGSDSDGLVVGEVTGDDSDLREHVVGILFAGHKLTSLQKQVMTHIVCAIGCEASRVRDDWETALLCAEAVERTDDEAQPRLTHQQDNYCFEMLSLLLALSGSVAGRSHLAQRTELLADLLALLHTGSERVQRQVISLLRRMIFEIPPQKMLAALNYGADLGARYESTVTLLDHLVCYVGKAVTVQVKVKGASGASSNTVTMGTTVTPAPPAAWFMRGETTRSHAQVVARLLTDMAEDKVSPAWGTATRMGLSEYVRAVADIEEMDRRPQRCIAQPTIWLALAALCICEQEYMDLINNSGRDSRNRDSIADSRQFCVNHDDGITPAVVDCRTCGTLCSECDRFLHLNRTARTHQRQICKEEESAIRVDSHEGCGRAKLFWLLLLVDRRTLKGLAEFRGMETGVCEPGEGVCSATGLAGVCRFCGTRGNSGLLAIGNVCADQQCQEHGREACARILPCGHICGGVRGERACLPCLFGCASADTLRQDADDMCMICFTDPLQAAPAIQLSCGHVFHLHCCRKVLLNKWNGPRITFSFSKCPICKEDMLHWTLEDHLAPIRKLREEVRRKALMRLEYEGLAASSSKGKTLVDPAGYAMERYAYYVCHKCGKAYFGGLARCEAESNSTWDPKELVCGACSDVAGARICSKHGSDFLEYKCRYCCSVAVFFCFGTSHFCNACHDDFQRVTNIPRHLLPQCPAGPKGEQLPGTTEECPLHVQHPATGEEFALGCGVCRNAHAF
ncbi:E3 ubiquitin-protein ligase highwire [Zerene cesonia]|uniref:E3 ubiquitin-protein ligase highwire n=1 Tax=Zerene cesonia TaxID=33412 RepID=UPI0018E4FE63|nr:E3 ubiquitin-protein ligase highwire [Zerene cesonia]